MTTVVRYGAACCQLGTIGTMWQLRSTFFALSIARRQSGSCRKRTQLHDFEAQANILNLNFSCKVKFQVLC